MDKTNYSIALIPGDGIGNEVTSVAFEVALKAAKASSATLVSTVYEWGTDYYFEHGAMAPVDAIETLGGHDAILLGAVGHPKVPDNVTLNGLLLPIRRRFDQFANVRPAVLYRGVSSPLKGMNAGDIDMVVVRENTEGEYAQVGGFVHETHPQEVAVQTSVFTRHGIERIIRYAFELAVKREKKSLVTSITKSNAQGFSMVLWDRVFQSVAAGVPRHPDRIAAGGRGRHELCASPANIRCSGGIDSIRRYLE